MKKNRTRSARGRPQKIDLSAMVVFARLLVVTCGVKPKPAARAGIRAWLTWSSADERTTPAEYRVNSLELAVLKALQRFGSGKSDIHPDLRACLGLEALLADPRLRTGAELGRKMGESVARFLPIKERNRILSTFSTRKT